MILLFSNHKTKTGGQCTKASRIPIDGCLMPYTCLEFDRASILGYFLTIGDKPTLAKPKQTFKTMAVVFYYYKSPIIYYFQMNFF